MTTKQEAELTAKVKAILQESATEDAFIAGVNAEFGDGACKSVSCFNPGEGVLARIKVGDERVNVTI